MNKTQEQVARFISECKLEGFSWSVVCGSVVRITKTFTPGDKDAFTACDMMASSVLAFAPLKGGSVWGTDGGSVGGHAGLTNGEFVLNKSGDGKRFISALKKLA